MANSILILSFIIIFSYFPLFTSSNNETDLLSLLAFKSAIDVDPLGALNSWNQTLHFCNWRGIRCSRKHPGRVIRITLASRALVGSLSPHVGNLSFLRLINLQNNTFHGLIPQELGRLRRLDSLILSNNSFLGPIPSNLSQCRNLVVLNLIDNNLSGTIPNGLESLFKLEHLGLGDNTFSGSIPSFLGNLTSLKQLGLGSCFSQGVIPESFARLNKLLYLFSNSNNLTGTIPSGLFNISTLRILILNMNHLHGSIPPTIGLTLPNLRTLHLGQNRFTGPIPVSLSNASFLLQLYFFRNYFTGSMPRDMGKLPYLLQFLIADNPIQDDIGFISSFTNCTRLQHLQLGQNLLTGSLPVTVANLSRHLSTFLIFDTEIQGLIPSGIGNLVGLTFLALSNNNLEGPIPQEIGKLINVGVLYLDQNRFTYEIPSSFGNLSLVTELYLQRNNFSGSIPSSLGNCTRLLLLDLSLNNLNSSIPREIMSVSSISISLNLSHNALTDLIPSEVGSLTNLGQLDLSNNRLSGPIPNSLSKCTSLEQLHLQGNLLGGEIPSGMSSLKALQDLDLSRNNLSGSIPTFFGELRFARLNISFNRLHGGVPRNGVFSNATAVSLKGNNGLCGGIPELKLPPCANSSEKNGSTLVMKILIPTCSSVAAAAFCFMIIMCRRRRGGANLPSLPSFMDGRIMRLSYAELVKATEGFSACNLVGVGRFGSVYKGVVVDGDGQRLVAVKVLNLVVRGAAKSFVAECNALRGIRHRNLVKILSVCESIDFQSNNFKALVYEFKGNGSLEKWLHHNRVEEEEDDEEFGEGIRRLSMMERLSIAIDIALALEYLHFGTGSTIVHGDLKPSNILLDDEMTACVGDFGLAKIVSNVVASHESNTSSFGIRGTLGYVPPEYGTSESVSREGDVYSYGIVVLEIFTNRRPTDDLFKDEVNLHNFVAAALPDQVLEIVDPKFLEEFNETTEKCVASILSIGVSCSKGVARDRMLITDVVSELHKIQKMLSRIQMKNAVYALNLYRSKQLESGESIREHESTFVPSPHQTVSSRS